MKVLLGIAAYGVVGCVVWYIYGIRRGLSGHPLLDLSACLLLWPFLLPLLRRDHRFNKLLAETERSSRRELEESPPRISFSGGPGDSAETAFVIEAPDTRHGTMVEYAIIQKRHGEMSVEWKRKLQILTSDETGKRYDKIIIELKDGSTRTYWFDITAFYGQLPSELATLLQDVCEAKPSSG